jgi:hypothetical protein
MAARAAAVTAAGLIAAVDAVYLFASDHGEAVDVAVLAPALALAALLAAIGPFTRKRRDLLGASCAVVVVVAVLTGSSIGPLLVPPVLLLAYAALS